MQLSANKLSSIIFNADKSERIIGERENTEVYWGELIGSLNKSDRSGNNSGSISTQAKVANDFMLHPYDWCSGTSRKYIYTSAPVPFQWFHQRSELPRNVTGVSLTSSVDGFWALNKFLFKNLLFSNPI